jgi:hypothetical protein
LNPILWMKQRVRTSFSYVFLISLFFIRSALANSCEGRGTVFFFGNGMFNTKEDTQRSLNALSDAIRNGILLDKTKDAKYRAAYKTNEPLLFQLFNVANQKVIDSWEDFWLWLSSIKQAPSWFQEILKITAEESLKSVSHAFEDSRDHFEAALHLRRFFVTRVLLVLTKMTRSEFFLPKSKLILSFFE